MTMNLDDNDSNAPVSKPAKLSRKEKKALKAEQKKAAAEEKERAKAEKKAAAAEAKAEVPDAAQGAPEEVSAQLEPAPIPSVPTPEYTLWEKISPPAKRKRQMANMEDGFREVLGLVQSMRENQEALLNSFQKLPEAVDSVKKLADHSARQSELLEAMNTQGEDGLMSGKFNDTLASMDNTTKQLLERSQRSEERLYTMLRRAQRRIAFMTLLVLLLFLGALAGALYYVFPEQTRSWLDGDGFQAPAEEEPVAEQPTATPAAGTNEVEEVVVAEPEVEVATNKVEDLVEELPAPVEATPLPTPTPIPAPAEEPVPEPEPVTLPEPAPEEEPEVVIEEPETPALEEPTEEEVVPEETEAPVEETEEAVEAPAVEAEVEPAP